MSGKLTIAAGGLVLAVALGVPAAAQATAASSRPGHTAAVVQDGPGHAAVPPSGLGGRAKATAVQPDSFPPGGGPGDCGQIWDRGNGGYATTKLGTNPAQIFFKPLSFFATANPSSWLVNNGPNGQIPPSYCNVSAPQSGKFEIYDTYTEGCFEANLNGQVDEDPFATCDGYPDWDLWNAAVVGSYHSNTLYQLKNFGESFEGGCLYDDLQLNPIYTTNGCSSTDGFEAFSWTGSNL
jgi:hypothetical protein